MAESKRGRVRNKTSQWSARSAASRGIRATGCDGSNDGS